MTTLYVDNIAPNLQSKISAPNLTLPSGSVIQVVQATDSTDRSTTSTSYVDASISVTITPQSASNQILLIWNFIGSVYGSPAGTLLGRFVITDSSNNIIGGENRIGIQGTLTQIDYPVSITRYVSPSTTSAVTYKGRFKLDNGSEASIYNGTFGDGQLIAMEIAG